MARFGALALLWLALPAAAGAYKASLEPKVAPPGTVLVCRLDGRAPEGMVLAGFQQEAGFYVSDGRSVALLAVPLGSRPGSRTLRLRWPGGSLRLRARVGRDRYPRHRVSAVRRLKQKLQSAEAAGEREELEEADAESRGQPLWNGPFHWPLPAPPTITSPFGSWRVYNRGQAAWRHKGLDLRAAEGTPVLAAADGVVLLARPGMALSGGTVVLGHGYGVTSSYFHLSRLRVRAGQAVHAGEPLGASGASGLASGPHLHWQVNLRGQAVDPGQWLGPARTDVAAQAAH